MASSYYLPFLNIAVYYILFACLSVSLPSVAAFHYSCVQFVLTIWDERQQIMTNRKEKRENSLNYVSLLIMNIRNFFKGHNPVILIQMLTF